MVKEKESKPFLPNEHTHKLTENVHQKQWQVLVSTTLPNRSRVSKRMFRMCRIYVCLLSTFIRLLESLLRKRYFQFAHFVYHFIIFLTTFLLAIFLILTFSFSFFHSLARCLSPHLMLCVNIIVFFSLFINSLMEPLE